MDTKALTPILCPFTIAIDSREQCPFTFEGISANGINNHRIVKVPTVWRGLPTGDYSIEGYESAIAIERKNLADLFSSFGKHGRERFEREHVRMRAIVEAGGFAAVIIEASWSDILNPPWWVDGKPVGQCSRMHPKSIAGAINAWMMRYKTHYLPMETRRRAEIECFRLLSRFYSDRQKEKNNGRHI